MKSTIASNDHFTNALLQVQPMFDPSNVTWIENSDNEDGPSIKEVTMSKARSTRKIGQSATDWDPDVQVSITATISLSFHSPCNSTHMLARETSKVWLVCRVGLPLKDRRDL